MDCGPTGRSGKRSASAISISPTPAPSPTRSKRPRTRQQDEPTTPVAVVKRDPEPPGSSRSLRHVKQVVKFDWDDDQVRQLKAALKAEDDEEDVKRGIKKEDKAAVRRASRKEDKHDVKRTVRDGQVNRDVPKPAAEGRQRLECVLLETKRRLPDADAYKDEEEDEEDEDDLRPRIPPLSVRTPGGDYITIQGAGLSDKDKAEIASTLGPLHMVRVPGVGETWCSRKMLEQYFYWCAERQQIFERREAGQQPPWSDDPLFQGRSSNVFRHQDRTSQFIINDIIDNYKCDPPAPGEIDHRWKDGVFVDNVEEACFRVMVFWQFGKMETWKGLRERLPRNDVRWATYNEKVYAAALRDLKNTGQALFTGSYQIHPHQGYGSSENFVNGLRSIKALMTGNDGLRPYEPKPPGVPQFHGTHTSLEEAFRYVNRFKGVGNYHGIQLTLHLNYVRFINLNTGDWICSGRGAKNGLSLILPAISFDDNTQLEGIKWLVDQQWEQWKRLGYTPASGLNDGPGNGQRGGVSLVDVENSLCLWQKYAREDRKIELCRRSGGVMEGPPTKLKLGEKPKGLRQNAGKEKTIIPWKYQNEASGPPLQGSLETRDSPTLTGPFGYRSISSSPLTEISARTERSKDQNAEAVVADDPDIVLEHQHESAAEGGTVGPDVVVPHARNAEVAGSTAALDVVVDDQDDTEFGLEGFPPSGQGQNASSNGVTTVKDATVGSCVDKDTSPLDRHVTAETRVERADVVVAEEDSIMQVEDEADDLTQESTPFFDALDELDTPT